MLIEQLPPILVLHLKRFIYDPAVGIGKNTKAIRYGPELVIRNGAPSSSHAYPTFFTERYL
jgi:ubiquitin carboxyl-terminal hydrolase 10